MLLILKIKKKFTKTCQISMSQLMMMYYTQFNIRKINYFLINNQNEEKFLAEKYEDYEKDLT